VELWTKEEFTPNSQNTTSTKTQQQQQQQQQQQKYLAKNFALRQTEQLGSSHHR
jgi:hypothetical protein